VASSKAPLVLASASPRRREILRELGLSFDVRPSGLDEVRLEDEPPEAYAVRAAADKAKAVMADAASERPLPYVLGADTVVALAGAVLGKPSDDEEARSMLERLSGRTHRVITGVAVGLAGAGVSSVLAVTTHVRFRQLDRDEIDTYVAGGEGRDKAGSYAVQGRGRALVAGWAGSYSNVVGLPAAETLQLLARAGAVEAWP